MGAAYTADTLSKMGSETLEGIARHPGMPMHLKKGARAELAMRWLHDVGAHCQGTASVCYAFHKATMKGLVSRGLVIMTQRGSTIRYYTSQKGGK